MIKKRVGTDLFLTVKIVTKQCEAVDLSEAYDVTVTVWHKRYSNSVRTVEECTVNGNEVSWQYSSAESTRPGVYGATVAYKMVDAGSETGYLQFAVDFCDLFELVECSVEETSSDVPIGVIVALGKDGKPLTFDDLTPEQRKEFVDAAAAEAAAVLQPELNSKQDALSEGQLANIAAVPNKVDKVEGSRLITNEEGQKIASSVTASVDNLQNYYDKTTVDAQNQSLQEEIDAITSQADVTDVVGTKAELDAYPTDKLVEGDVVKVLSDESRNGERTYYRWVSQAWAFVGSEGLSYTKSEADAKFAGKQDKLSAEQLENIAAVPNKVDKVEGSRLMTNEEGQKVADALTEVPFATADTVGGVKYTYDAETKTLNIVTQ